MEMLLMGGALSLMGFAVVCLAFGAATRGEPAEVPAVKKTVATHPPASRFFAPARRGLPAQIPIDALLLQIENHVRLEQAAAESFVEYPTAALLHSRTMSPLIQ